MKIRGIQFTEFIREADIQKKVRQMASEINTHYAGKSPVFLPVLNGAFMFASDLLKGIEIPCKVSFVKISSYEGLVTTGQLKTLIGVDESLFKQDVIIVEDVVDTGLTLEKIVSELRSLGARSVETATLLRKKTARDNEIDVRYIGFDIEEEFVLGYGLDFDGFGRNHRQLLKAVRNEN